mmetsp:Transcript_41012/g.88471  ORF Transcript_41012/g.88471 Transcript_41012/m.88471 type:complete len:399 (-) Transcript_41012:16-1212(-)
MAAADSPTSPYESWQQERQAALHASRADVVEALRELRALDLQLREALHARQSTTSEAARLREECEQRRKALASAQQDVQDLEHTLGQIQSSHQDVQLRTAAAEAREVHFNEVRRQVEFKRKDAEVRAEMAAARSAEARARFEQERDASDQRRKAEILAAEERFRSSEAKRQAAGQRARTMYCRHVAAQRSLAREAYCASRPHPVVPYVSPPLPRDLREPLTEVDRLAALKGIPVEQLDLELELELDELALEREYQEFSNESTRRRDRGRERADGHRSEGSQRGSRALLQVRDRDAGLYIGSRSKKEAIRALGSHCFGDSSTFDPTLDAPPYSQHHKLFKKRHVFALNSEAAHKTAKLCHYLQPSATVASLGLLNASAGAGRLKSHKELVFLHAALSAV